MTDLIPDSWELPSYLAGDVIPFGRRQGPQKPLVTPETSSDWSSASRALGEIEPYNPEIHGYGKPELYTQDALDSLGKSGFQQDEDGYWRRPFSASPEEQFGYHHISYVPGYRTPEGARRPWHLTTDPEQVGSTHSTVRGAIQAADDDMARLHPKEAAQSPGRANAEDWLARNTPESFEEDPREAAEQWMRDHAHEYEEWHPSSSDYTYGDFGDMAGQSFHGDEAQSHVLPSSAYNFNEEPNRHHPDMFGDEFDNDEETEDQRNLAEHGFNWHPDEDSNNAEDGIYIRNQHTPEGQHIATHRIYQVPLGEPGGGRWHLETSPADTPDFVSHHSNHGFVSDAVDTYRQQAAENLLPSRGYEASRGRTGWARYWEKTEPNGYHHVIEFPEQGGFSGITDKDDLAHGSFAPNNYQKHSSDDLADVVREQDRLAAGLHPGGRKDHRATREELLSDPSVARLGEPSNMSTDFWRDGKVGSARWQLPHPNPPHQTVFDPTAPGHARQVPSENPWINAEATYDWDKGGYNFKYTHNGERIYPNQEHFPAGAPVHVPGRQTQLPLESAR